MSVLTGLLKDLFEVSLEDVIGEVSDHFSWVHTVVRRVVLVVFPNVGNNTLLVLDLTGFKVDKDLN